MLRKIPTEIVLKVLENLDFFDLKLRVPLVCKDFYQLVNTRTEVGIIDKTLFRDTPRPTKIYATITATTTPTANATAILEPTKPRFNLHPILSNLTYYIPENAEDKGVFKMETGGRSKSLDLARYRLGDVNAVSRAVSRAVIVLEAEGGIAIDGKDNEALENPPGQPVTIAQVIDTFMGVMDGTEWDNFRVMNVLPVIFFNIDDQVKLVDGVVHIHVSMSSY